MTPESDVPPPRPRTEYDLGFKPQRSERLSGWEQLVPSTLRRLLGLDSPPIQSTPCICEREDGTNPMAIGLYDDREELWVDYVSGTGGAFNATYSVAWLLAQPLLEVGDRVLPRANLLLLGGNLVTPAGDGLPYNEQLVGPYRASFPYNDTGVTHDVYALPGTADYREGTSTFHRVFCSKRWLGGRKTVQSRPYFALRLPHRYWIWGLAIPPNEYLDEAQLGYFQHCAMQLAPDDQVIVCASVPPWEEDYVNVDYVRRELIEAKGAVARLVLVGGDHFYCRFAAPDERLIVMSAGGGASLHGTHALPHEVTVHDMHGPEMPYQRLASYPSPRASRRLLWATAYSLPWKQPQFTAAMGGLYLFIGIQFTLAMLGEELSFLESLRRGEWLESVGAGGTGFLIELLVLAMVGFVRSVAPHPVARVLNKVLLAALLSAVHLVAVLSLGWLVAALPLGGILQVLVFAVVFVCGGGLIGGWVLGTFLAVHHWFSSAHKDQAYVGGAGDRYKKLHSHAHR